MAHMLGFCVLLSLAVAMRFEVQIELGGTQTPLAFEADDGRTLHAAMRQFCADNNYRFANATADASLGFCAASMLLTSHDAFLQRVGRTDKEGGVYNSHRQMAWYAALAGRPWVHEVCEIGFNAGHSALIWLAAGATRVTAFDLGVHNASGAAAEARKPRAPPRPLFRY